MSDETHFGEEELREAEALAQALERGAASDALPEDALQAAALIRYGADGGALAKDREDAILADVLAAAERVASRASAERPRAPWWRWALGFAGLALAAALVLLFLRPPSEGTPTALPTPSRALLEAQLARVDESASDGRFEEEMGHYRGAVYAALEARYGAR